MRKIKDEAFTRDWGLYVKGADWLSTTGYKTSARKNERFYRGDQWAGVKAGNLPTPVFNIFKRITDYVVSYVASSPVKISFTADDREAGELLSLECEAAWEKDKMDKKIRKALLDAAITGDMCAHVYWDGKEGRPGGAFGNFRTEILDAENVFFGDVTTPEVERQPYILIAGRAFTSELIGEAKAAGVPKKEAEKIVPDSDTYSVETSDGTPRTTYVVVYRKGKDGFIHYSKSTREAVIREDVNTGLRRYPVAFANWTEKKGSFHGESFCGGIVPNQIFINKMFAMSMKSLMDTAFPKAVYDKTKVSGWTNAVGTAIGVNGDVSGVAKYLEGKGIDPDAMTVADRTIKYTEECLGATDVLLGQSIRPDNAAAIAALGQNAAIPMELIRQSLYDFIEDVALIWLDFLKTKFTAEKTITVEKDGKLETLRYLPEIIRRAEARVKIDVGPSAYISELSSVGVLGNLYSSGAINAVQYIERLPKGYVPAANELIEELSSHPEEKSDM